MPSLNPLRPHDEFPAGADQLSEGFNRREFLRLAGASAALAGVAGCGRPAKTLVPYVTQPEAVVPGLPSFYATAIPWEGFARGILVETHEGRPTKIEGNPDDPESLGATDAITQASILSLYDPERSRAPLCAGQPSSWSAWVDEWIERRRQLSATGGRGWALLTEPTTSPTLLREIHRLLDRFPGARWHQHTALARYDEDGAQPDCDPGRAEVILAVESDFLQRHPASLRYARAFAARRRVADGVLRPNRLYVIEAAFSATGAMADHRLPVSPGRLRRVLAAVAAQLDGGPGAADLTEAERTFVARLAGDLRARAPDVLAVAGAEQDPEVRRWVRALNERLGVPGRTAASRPPVRSDGDPRSTGGLAELAAAMDRGEVSSLVILGANPAYTAPADLDFPRRLAGVAWTAHAGGHRDETARLCRWHLPESHYLETWLDLRGYGGGAVIQQPLIDPLHDTRGPAELVRLLADGTEASGYDLVRENWLAAAGDSGFGERWRRWLNAGRVDGVSLAEPAEPAARPAAAVAAAGPEAVPAAPGPFVVFRPDPYLGDGRWANNAWLQELPRPFSALVWDNAIFVPRGLADGHGLAEGDVAVLRCGGRSVRGPIGIARGLAEDCILVHLGGGRTGAGAVGDGRGFDAYRLRAQAALWAEGGATLAKTGETHELVSTQRHFSMEGRDLARWVPAAAALTRKPAEPAPSLYAAWPRPGHAWGMSIDLSTCLGCSACVAACQAENNIPVVGRAEVARGREMHWLRVDRYYEGEEGNLRTIAQPVPCMQCENAPCELVCPVAATVHSSEGLNQMVYNRCVGTRYCSNNCPYKVRRFNFFDFRAPADSPVHLQENPNVTVRERGVMEKCTYCVQRIEAGKIAAERDGRPLRDGDIRTACQQVCPVEAIVFGDLADPASGVARRKREPGDYALLAELNTRPRTTYLPKMFNSADAP
jgi:Fe-S-cluster-containing dehydrogenase component